MGASLLTELVVSQERLFSTASAWELAMPSELGCMEVAAAAAAVAKLPRAVKLARE